MYTQQNQYIIYYHKIFKPVKWILFVIIILYNIMYYRYNSGTYKIRKLQINLCVIITYWYLLLNS